MDDKDKTCASPEEYARSDTMELPGPSGRLGRRAADIPILTQRWV